MAPWLKALLAGLPVLTVFGLIGSRRVPAHLAALAGALLSYVLAITVWPLGPGAALWAGGYGAATGLFPIVYIVWGSLLLYDVTVVTGWAERLRASLTGAFEDRDLLLLLVGFGFVAFLDSTAGFLTPVTVGTALLVGLGVPAVLAASYTLVASSLPPIFGAMGIPVLVMAEAAGIPLPAFARAEAAVAAILFSAFPAWITFAFGGAAALRRLWRSAIGAGVAYAVILWLMVTRVSLYPAALTASLGAIGAILLLAPARRGEALRAPRSRRWGRAEPWWPYGMLAGAVVLWSLPPVTRWLGRFTLSIPFPAATPALTWRLDLLASPGTAILLSAFLVAALCRASTAQVGEAVRLSARQLRHPLVGMLAMFAMAQVMSASQMTQTLATTVAGTRGAFSFLSPFISWLGVAIAGSNTASNVLLGNLQGVAASRLGLDVARVAALAGAAAALGKMAAPQVISAAVGAAGLAGGEGRLLRVGLVHGLVWTGILGVAGYVLGG